VREGPVIPVIPEAMPVEPSAPGRDTQAYKVKGEAKYNHRYL